MEYVIKRNGEKATFQISKIREVINWACKDIDINPLKLESSITSKFKNNIKTSDIQDILIQTCTSLASIDEPEWNSMEQEVYDMFKEAVKQEIEFSTHVIGDKILGMTCDSIEQYTKYLANKRLKAIGMNHIYEGIKNPYTHLEAIGGVEDEGSSKSNMFETQSIAYKQANILSGWDDI